MTVSEALLRVWRWKEAVYEDVKDLSPEERAEHYCSAARQIEEQTGGEMALPAPRKKARGRRRS